MPHWNGTSLPCSLSSSTGGSLFTCPLSSSWRSYGNEVLTFLCSEFSLLWSSEWELVHMAVEQGSKTIMHMCKVFWGPGSKLSQACFSHILLGQESQVTNPAQIQEIRKRTPLFLEKNFTFHIEKWCEWRMEVVETTLAMLWFAELISDGMSAPR